MLCFAVEQLKADGTKPKSGPLRGNTTITLGIENPPPCTGTGAACEITCRFNCSNTIHEKTAELRNNVLEVESDLVTEACTDGTLEITSLEVHGPCSSSPRAAHPAPRRIAALL